MKVRIYRDEAWPVYGLVTDPSSYCDMELELPDELVARWQKLDAEYWAVHTEVSNYVRKERGKP